MCQCFFSALGEDELKQFQTAVENETEIRLRGEFAEKCHMFEAEKRFAIDRNATEIHARYEELFKAAQEELQEKLRVNMESLFVCTNKLL